MIKVFSDLEHELSEDTLPKETVKKSVPEEAMILDEESKGPATESKKGKEVAKPDDGEDNEELNVAESINLGEDFDIEEAEIDRIKTKYKQNRNGIAAVDSSGTLEHEQMEFEDSQEICNHKAKGETRSKATVDAVSTVEEDDDEEFVV